MEMKRGWLTWKQSVPSSAKQFELPAGSNMILLLAGIILSCVLNLFLCLKSVSAHVREKKLATYHDFTLLKAILTISPQATVFSTSPWARWRENNKPQHL
uniref:Uncharacterized protein n=1 Tax=Sinocyclocheilus grahami TaxID=75366 RepID=A0A672S2H1_SINGR